MKRLLVLIFLLSFRAGPIKILELPDGKLEWTTERPGNARFCVPAAFTDLDGRIEGEYRLKGVVHNPGGRRKVSICDDTFIIDRKWHSNSGFTQLILVNDGKANRFRDKKKFVRRALCKKDGHVFLVESRHRMTLTTFAAECAKVSTHAVYLDMGIYGYGYLEGKRLSSWAFFYRGKQTNWLCIR